MTYDLYATHIRRMRAIMPLAPKNCSTLITHMAGIDTRLPQRGVAASQTESIQLYVCGGGQSTIVVDYTIYYNVGVASAQAPPIDWITAQLHPSLSRGGQPQLNSPSETQSQLGCSSRLVCTVVVYFFTSSLSTFVLQ